MTISPTNRQIRHTPPASHPNAAQLMPINSRYPIWSRWFVWRLLALVLLLAGVSPARAGTDFCSGYPVVNGFHVIDGNDPSLNTLTLPSSIGIDATCYFKNFQVSAKWPQGLTST